MFNLKPSDIFTMNDSAGNNLFSIDENGNTTITGVLTVNVENKVEKNEN